MALDIEKEITALRKLPDFGQWVEQALTRIQQAVNTLGKNVGADASGTVPAPPQIQQLMVKTNGTGLVHAVITDNNPIAKHLNYFVEYDTNPSFLQPHVVHLGASRSMSPLNLPGMDDNGNPQSFYFRAYSQYLGGKPGGKVSSDTPVSPGGTQMLTLIPSTGSGTAQATGQEGGQGFGKDLFRPGVSPKRA